MRPKTIWPVAEAKSRLSEVIALAVSSGPQAISRHGREIAVVVSAEEWERKAHRKGSLAEFFENSPLPGSGIKVTRKRDKPRNVDL